MDILLKNANIIHVVSSTIAKGDILVADGHIKAISENIIIDNIDLVDCTDKWIIPGLIDMHVHIKDSFAPLFTAAGVTTVRNTSGSIIELEIMMKADITASTPRVITSDRLIDGPPGLWGPTSPYSVNISDLNSAKEEVRRQVSQGAELIKVYGLLEKDIMKEVCEESRRYNKDVSADLVHSTHLNALDAAEIGVSWLEHASGILQMVHPEWSMKADAEVYDNIDWINFDVHKIKEVCSQLIKHNVSLCPTITLYDQGFLDEKPWNPKGPIIERLEENLSLINQWKYIMQSGHIKNKIGIQNEFIKQVSKVYHELGGRVVCGTDTPAGVNVYPGLSLHRELELFVESGFTEFEAIRASTVIPADAIRQKKLGRIVEGAIADLVILNSNPIEEVSNTRDIKYIIKGGKQYTPSDIIDAVPTDEENLKTIDALVKKFEANGFAVDQFR